MLAQVSSDSAAAGRRSRIAVAGALGALAVVAWGCGSDRPPDDERPIHGSQLAIYASAPLHGPGGAAGKAILRAQRLALAQDGGRIGRYRVRLVTLDAARPFTGGSDPAKVSLNARRAARDPQAVAYLGEVRTGASAVSIPILNEAGILEVSPLDTALGLTTRSAAITGSPERYYPNAENAGRTFARLVPDDRAQAVALLRYMRDEGVRRIALLNDDDGPGLALAGSVRGAARENGIEVVVSEQVDAHQQQHPDLVAEIAALRPDAVLYAGGLRAVAAQVWRQIATAEPGMKLFVSSMLADAAFAASLAATETVVHATRPLPAASDGDQRAVRRFTRAFEARYGTVVDPEALYGYESMRVALAAIRAAERKTEDGSIARDDVVRAFFEAGARDGVLGPYRIDANGDTSLRRWGAFRLIDGQLRFQRAL